MNKERFFEMCELVKSGKDAYVSHPSSGEEGRIVGCLGSEAMVNTRDGQSRKWEYVECTEIGGFSKGSSTKKPSKH